MTVEGLTLHGIDVDPPRDLMGRIWARDPGVWGEGEDDPAERLGWLDLPERFADRLEGIEEFAATVTEDVAEVVLLGMGGSSLAPEVFAKTQPGAARDLVVADSTHPAEVRRVRDAIDLERSLFVVSSKSGSTIETTSLYQYYRALVTSGERFVAITDPGTSLALLGEEEFAKTFRNPRDIGGRYSALSYFGLVPAVLVGIDLHGVFETARAMSDRCSTEVPPEENPALVLGSAVAQLALQGRDKLTFLISEEVAAFGDWAEQLVAESTGKQGKGVVPIVGEPAVASSGYGVDRTFVVLRMAGDSSIGARAGSLADDGHPVIVLEMGDERDIGAQMFLWELATAVAGALMGINPFDQPDVEAAKKASRSVLESGDPPSGGEDDPDELFGGLSEGELAVVCAFAPRNSSTTEVLEASRAKILHKHRVATMAGFGPRYLHSTGQLHKGGSPHVRVLVVLDEPEFNEPIPGAPHGFKELVAAQAVGDARALEEAGRRVARTTWAAFEEWTRT